MSELIRLELKYCERCGGLLLRRAGLTINFCKPCQRIEHGLPPATAQRSPAKRLSRPATVLPFRPASVKFPGTDFQACCEGEHA